MIRLSSASLSVRLPIDISEKETKYFKNKRLVVLYSSCIASLFCIPVRGSSIMPLWSKPNLILISVNLFRIFSFPCCRWFSPLCAPVDYRSTCVYSGVACRRLPRRSHTILYIRHCITIWGSCDSRYTLLIHHTSATVHPMSCAEPSK